MDNLTYRPRRLRLSESIRQLAQETRLAVTDFVYPLFVVPGSNFKEEIASMPGIYRFSPDLAVEEAKRAVALGILGVLLFGTPEHKDAHGSGASDAEGAVQQTARLLKKHLPQLTVITDVCLCQYTDHGHCGLIENGKIMNDATLPLLAEVALSHAAAGADIVAPSDMMDARVAAIRGALDQKGFQDVLVMSYAAKYASAYYGPFREAVSSAPQFGDRKTYQMDPANAREALKEVQFDLKEGADIIIVKPALSYLDIICRVKEACPVPVAAYNVSGEYSMLKHAALKGLVEEKRIVLETLLGMKRAGADIIITYHALDAAKWLKV
jgi:porphobilinogen synthase